MKRPRTLRRAAARRWRALVAGAGALALVLVVHHRGNIVTAAGTQANAAAAPDAIVRRAVLVGIDKYVFSAAPPGGARPRDAWSDLDGAVNDVEALRQVLVTRFGFKPDDVHVLLNADATRDDITAAIRQWLIAPAAAGDVSFFFYAGHGSQVRNSKSAELDKLDESIVPADANTGRPDLRDKELAQLFDEALDKRVSLTVAFDSCHSGSIGRGAPRPTKFRMLQPDLRDVNDPASPVPPEQRGALVLSAARDDQLAAEARDDDGTAHGLFTWALLKTLRTMPVNQSADRMFLQLRALMQSGDTFQEPALASTPERRRAPLFGARSAALSGATVVAVQSVSDGTVVLQAGLAAGVRTGAELRAVGAAPETAITLRVTEEQGPARSGAVITSGDAKAITPGMLFEVVRWAAPHGPALRVWIGTANLPLAQVMPQTQEMTRRAAIPGIIRIDDPTTDNGGDAPLQVIRWTGDEWSSQHLASAGRVMVSPPMPSEAAADLRLGAGTANDAIELLPAPDHADYLLVGRLHAETLEYAWVRPLVDAATVASSALPVRTDWVALGSGGPAALAASLRQQAVRLGVIRSWLQLESPADPGRFPYHLALKNTATGALRTAGPTTEGEQYGLVLVRDENAPGWPGSFDQRYVYAFAIDNAGKGTLLYPSVATGGIGENHLPVFVGQDRTLPEEIPLGPRNLFSVTPPFGVDTFVLLTTGTALADPTVLDWDPLRTRSDARGATDPLSRLLNAASGGRRGQALTAPADWSIERMAIQSAR